MDRSHREQFNTDIFSTQSTSEFKLFDSVDASGNQVDKDSVMCVAKVFRPKTKGQLPRFYIKKSFKEAKFFNPYKDSLDSLKSTRQSQGRTKWDFALVSEESYVNYLKFLKNGHEAFLSNAERLA